MTSFRVASATDIGRKRSQNQDSLSVHPEMGLFVVADGMGGHKGGETASRIAVETIAQVVRESCKDASKTPRTLITEAIVRANAAIQEHARHHEELQGMGTTTTALLFKNGMLTIGHVGDSRCYAFRPLKASDSKIAGIWQATRDHSLVQEKLRAGIITREESKTDKMKNVITRSVGFESTVSVELYEMAVRPGDAFLMCSDGLSGLIEDLDMLKIVDQKLYQNENADEAVHELIQLANNNGGDDNITAVLVQVIH